MTETLEARVQKLEDINEIIKLQSIYASYLDRGYAGRVMHSRKAAEFYVEDGTWEFEAAGMIARGHDQIAGILDEACKMGDFYMHAFMTPVINVSGNTAYVEWLMLVGHVVNDKVVLTYGNENIDYVKTEKGWRIKRNRFSLGKVLTT